FQPNDQIRQGVALRPGQQLHQIRVRKYSDVGSILLPRERTVHTGGGPFDTLCRSLAMMVHVATVRQFMGHERGSLVIGANDSAARNKGGRRGQIERTRYPYLADVLRESRSAKCLADDPFFQLPAFEKDRVLVGSVWSAVAVVEVDHAVGADFIRLEPRMNGQTGLRGQKIKTASGADLIEDKKILLLRRATNVFIGGGAADVKAAVFFVKRQAISTISVTHRLVFIIGIVSQIYCIVVFFPFVGNERTVFALWNADVGRIRFVLQVSDDLAPVRQRVR